MSLGRAASSCLAVMFIASCADSSPQDLSVRERERLATTEAAEPAQGTASYEQVKLGELVFDVLIAGPADGTPVMLLHGFPQTAREWRAQVEALAAAGYRVIAPNQRGYSPGARPSEVAAYATVELVRDVLGIADALDADRFHLVGHDWGALVAWAVAAAAPARTLTVTPISVPHPDAFDQVLKDPSSCQPRASAYFALFTSPAAEATLLANNAAFLRAAYAGLPPATIDAYVQSFDRPTLTGALNWYRANLAAGSARAPLGPITVPTMFIWSDRDSAICRDGPALTGDFVTGPYRFEVLEGINHWVPELAADRVNALLLEHFAAHADAR